MNNNILTPKKTEKFFEENVKFQKPLSEIEIDKNILSIFNEDIIKKYIVLPYKLENNVLTVITSTNNMNKQRDISLSIKKILSINNKNWNITIKYTDNNSELKRIITQNTQYTFSTIANNDKEINIDMPATRQKVLNMINVAIDRDVSDIHILPNINGIIVAFRVNGSLKDVSDEFKFTLDQRKQIANIAKNLDESGQARTSSDLVPSRGSFEVKHNGINVNIRISTVPTAAGYEKINFRLLVKRNNKRKITDLGYAKEDIDIIRLANKITTNGLFITAGPTGSGKSTMIFSVLYDEVDRAMLNYNELKNVMTIENPVEISEPSFTQTQPRLSPDKPELNLDAPRLLTTFLRQDPDLILYGEIRTKIDASVATMAGQTGHKVYATVHANDCVTTILRLLDLGVSRVSLLEQIRMIMSQRLIKILCPHCSKEYHLTEQDKIILDENDYNILSKSTLKTIGNIEDVEKCEYCNGIGYIKRIPILEYIIMTDELRDLFMDSNIKYTEIASILKHCKFKNMWQKTFNYIKDGKVDLGEAISTVSNKTAVDNIIKYIQKEV